MEPKLSGNVVLKTSLTTNALNQTIYSGTVGASGKVEVKNGYAQLEAGYGTVGYAKAETGIKIPIGESKFGVTTSLGGQYAISSNKKENIETKYNDARGYGNFAFTYSTPVFQAGLGGRIGVKHATEQEKKATKMIATPIFNMEVGKKFKFCLNASFDEVSIGGMYCF